MTEEKIILREVSTSDLIARIARSIRDEIAPLLNPQRVASEEDLLTVKESASYLRISPSSLARYARAGHLVSRGPAASRRILYRRGDLDAFIVAHRR